jgi:hypothetical protein
MPWFPLRDSPPRDSRVSSGDPGASPRYAAQGGQTAAASPPLCAGDPLADADRPVAGRPWPAARLRSAAGTRPGGRARRGRGETFPLHIRRPCGQPLRRLARQFARCPSGEFGRDDIRRILRSSLQAMRAGAFRRHPGIRGSPRAARVALAARGRDSQAGAPAARGTASVSGPPARPVTGRCRTSGGTRPPAYGSGPRLRRRPHRGFVPLEKVREDLSLDRVDPDHDAGLAHRVHERVPHVAGHGVCGAPRHQPVNPAPPTPRLFQPPCGVPGTCHHFRIAHVRPLPPKRTRHRWRPTITAACHVIVKSSCPSDLPSP